MADIACTWANSWQVVDAYGNLTEKHLYNYGNASTSYRDYYLSYLIDSTYNNTYYIRNRLIRATVSASDT